MAADSNSTVFFPLHRLIGLGREAQSVLRPSSARAIGNRVSPGLATGTGTLAGRFASLLDSAEGLLGHAEGDGLFSSMSVSSSNEAILTGSARSGAAPGVFDVVVDRPANSMTVVSNQLVSAAENATGGGYFEFAVAQGGAERRFSILLRRGDSNEEALQKIAGAINDAGAGLKAVVKENHLAKTSQLEVSGLNPGARSDFSLRDVSGSLLSTIGFTTGQDASGDRGGVKEAAQNAVFTINGVRFESASNQVSLFEDSLTVTVKQTTYRRTPEEQFARFKERLRDGQTSFPNVPAAGSADRSVSLGARRAELNLVGSGGASVTIQIKPDAETIALGIESFIEHLNGTLSALPPNAGEPGRSIGAALRGAVGTSSAFLSSIGIERGSDGRFQVDRAKLMNALNARPDEVRTAFAGPDGLGSEIARIARKFLLGRTANEGGHQISGSPLQGFSGLLFDGRR